MRLGGRTLLAGAAVAISAAALAGACSYPSVPPPPAPMSGGSCSTMPGMVPPSDCDDTPEDCKPPMPACPTDPCIQGSPCLAMTQNVPGQPADLRLRKLHITAPPALVNPQFLQTSIIDQGVNLKNLCGEGGDGSFSWLVHFDVAGKRVTTGGAPPTSDPINVGYCFVNEKIAGLNVQPVTVSVTQAKDGTWTSTMIPKLYVPIYVHGMASDVVVLPLTDATVENVTLSPDGNCIGSYNPTGVDSPADVGGSCADQDPSGCVRWRTAGALGGFITLEEADKVYIQDLSKSLCVLLTKGASLDPTGQYCGRDASGKLTVTGDFCSTTDSPGGCVDSFWLAATFAASAAKINDGTQDPACNGSGVVGEGDGGGPDGSPPVEGGSPEGGGPESGVDASEGGPG